MNEVDELKLNMALQAHEKQQRLERESAVGRFLMDFPVGVSIIRHTDSWAIRCPMFTCCAGTLEETIRFYQRQDEVTGRWLPSSVAS